MYMKLCCSWELSYKGSKSIYIITFKELLSSHKIYLERYIESGYSPPDSLENIRKTSKAWAANSFLTLTVFPPYHLLVAVQHLCHLAFTNHIKQRGPAPPTTDKQPCSRRRRHPSLVLINSIRPSETHRRRHLLRAGLPRLSPAHSGPTTINAAWWWGDAFAQRKLFWQDLSTARYRGLTLCDSCTMRL